MAQPLNPLPALEQLPLRKGDPPNSAWGLWGDGPDSALGSLNYLTDEVVSRAVREEIKTGERVGLKYVLLRPREVRVPAHINMQRSAACH